MSAISEQSRAFVHPSALCESESVGDRTRIWAFAHVMRGAIVGCDCNIGDHAFIESGARIGDRVTIKNGVAVWNGVTLEDDVFVGPIAVFTNDRHPRSPRAEHARERYAHVENWLSPTLVRQGASIGAGAVILCGITIRQHAMIAAGAVVTRDVPDHALMLGNPARQRGWTCICGKPLNSSNARNESGGPMSASPLTKGGKRGVAVIFICKVCSRSYEENNTGLKPLE